MCYITYAVPVDELPDFSKFTGILNGPAPLPAILPETPSTFVPEWFYGGGFPEDDID